MENNILHKIRIRQVTESDLSDNCPFPKTDTKTFEEKLGNFISEISEISGIKQCTRNNLSIEIKSDLGIKETLNLIEEKFVNYGQYLRYDGPPWPELED